MADTSYPPEVQAVLDVWRPYVASIKDWRAMTKGVEPKAIGCGLVYELANPLGRAGESFGFADMRQLAVAEPHYHPDNNWEFYFVMQGSGLVVVGRTEQRIGKGDTIVVLPDKAHYTIPNKDLVLALVNSPPFQPEIYVTFDPEKSHDEIDFDAEQFRRLTAERT